MPYGGQPGYGQPYGSFGDPNVVDVPGKGPTRLAGGGRRIAARFLDWIVVFVILLVLAGAHVYRVHITHTTTNINGTTGTSIDYHVYGRDLLINAVVSFLYDALLIGLVGGTLGMKLLGVKVIRASDGRLPGFGAGAIRALILVVLGPLLCGIGYLIIGFSFFWDGKKRRQGWHDKAAGVLVVMNN